MTIPFQIIQRDAIMPDVETVMKQKGLRAERRELVPKQSGGNDQIRVGRLGPQAFKSFEN